LFDSPQPRQLPNRSASLSSQHRHSANPSIHQQPASPAATNQRVAQIIQATGHSPLNQSPLVNANRFNTQFYASSAPSSTISLSPQPRQARPPVPLFNQSIGSVPTAKMMNAAGLSFRTRGEGIAPSSPSAVHSDLHALSTDVDLDEFTAFEGGVNTAYSSPAVPTNFDFGGSASSSTSNLGTVSPNDLVIGDSFMSAPNSAALTALTSPSINESPDFDGFDVSPNFGTADFEGPPMDAWYPLFPTESHVPDQNLENSPALKSEEFDMESLERASVGPRRKSSATNSPSGGSKHSAVAGVNARKRDKPLPPIIVEDPNDSIAMKRARNTLAARKSRERKAQRFDELEDRIAKLEAERDHWKNIALSQAGAQN
jgi:hypothetical protein